MKLITGSQRYWIDQDGNIYKDQIRKIKPYVHTSKKELAKGKLPRYGIDLDIGRKQYHRVVAENLVSGWFEGAYVDHKDRNPTNNHPSNLRWVTPSENRLNCNEVLRTQRIKETWRKKLCQ
jgi:hypothetical protein